MNIRNKKHFRDSFWDWTFLNAAFHPTKIRVTDIDGLVERNGHFLLIETKKEGASIPRGQGILHDQLLSSKIFTIFIVWGEPNNPVALMVRFQDAHRYYSALSLDDLTAHVRRWFLWANKQK